MPSSRLYLAVAIFLSVPSVTSAAVDSALVDDFSTYPYLWQVSPQVTLGNPEIPAGDPLALPGQTAAERVLSVRGPVGLRLARPYVASRDWSLADGLRFWYFGRNSGGPVGLEVRDNRVPDPGPAGWQLAWQDEFNGPAGQPVDAAHWSHEIGDGTAQGIPGWGNNEREYYTDSPANASLDGGGHLLISVRRPDGPLSCYYGPCEYTSARLISRDKVEIGHGRIEARIKVPAGAGLWPAFWALGSNIGQVGWPASGEIDIMEYLGRNPNEVFGTLHGPGYSGGGGISGLLTLPQPVSNDYHIFAIEWQSDRIDWYVDGTLYHSATPADIGTNQWVFNKPFFMILNVAVGGNLGGTVDPGLVFPLSMAIDYVRVYAAPDTAERFEADFPDDFIGWQEISLPFSGFVRSAQQPIGAPNDGLTLDEVWGYGLQLPGPGLQGRTNYLDKVRLIQPTSAVVVNALDDGPGSLRRAVAAVANEGMVTFDPSVAGATITLSSGPIWVSSKEVTIDAAAAPGITVQGTGSDRLLIVDPDARATVRRLTFANGFGWELAGAILDNGWLELDHVVVRNSTVSAAAGQWWMGGGGVYVGGGATLRLKDSTVRNNVTNNGVDGGGIYVFQNGTLSVERSTISGNVAANVGGGLRMLGSGTITNSTFSGNTTVGWHGSALFVTDGVLSVVNSTISANTAPAGTGAVFVGTFTAANATLNFANTIVAQNSDMGCFVGNFGPGLVTLSSGGHNVFTDGTCNPVGSDLVVGNAGLAALADNGGPTATQALLPGSPALDAADGALCPATDQRGVARPQGAGCDVGAFELSGGTRGVVGGAASRYFRRALQ